MNTNSDISIFRFVVLFIILLQSSLLYSQTIVVKGEIMDRNTGQLIQNVNIVLKGTTIGTTSDEQGKFSLNILYRYLTNKIIFEHISYDTLEILVSEAANQEEFYLTARILEASLIGVNAEKHTPYILNDIPQSISIIESKKFEAQGYVDSGDLLKTDQSVQVNEELSGKKTISLRGGNADDALVLFNGIKMNSIFDNEFDFSFIDLSEIKRVEIIKGSNTALYGSGAFSGVINIVPKINKDYLIKFQQRFGPYNQGEWNLGLNRLFFNRLNLSYAIKRGASQRNYADAASKSDFIENKTINQQITVLYEIPKQEKEEANSLNLTYFRKDLDHNNFRSGEDEDNSNEVATIKYSGNIYSISGLDISGSYHRLNTEQTLATYEGKIERNFQNYNYNFNLEKKIQNKDFDLILAFQHQKSILDYKDERYRISEDDNDLLSSDFNQQRNGIVSVFKIHAPTASDYFNKFDFDLSYRFDQVSNKRSNANIPVDSNTDITSSNSWQKSTVKFSTLLAGSDDLQGFDAYLNFGTNVKFPSIFQQISNPTALRSNDESKIPKLQPEEIQSIDIGIKNKRYTPKVNSIDYWQISTTFFKNFYSHKFREYYQPGSPVAFYDVVETAIISGFDFIGSISMFYETLLIEPGVSFYDISDLAAFPFKYESKKVLNVSYDYKGYYVHFHWFNEGKQIGAIRTTTGEFESKPLPEYSNIDLHISKSIEIYSIKFIANFSGRNLLDTETRIQGIAIRDRRIYLTLGVEY